jgi:defect-in-organelle-trafficking protein DotB
MSNDDNILYPNEPPRFNANDIEDFIKWSTSIDTSDVTIQNEEEIFCEIHGRMRRVTKRKLSKAEVMDIIGGIYKSDGAIAKLNGGEDVDLPWTIKISRDKSLRYRVNMTSIFTNGHKGYSITIRTIKNRAPLLEDLKLPKDILDNISPKTGLVMVVGATGSGKSTLLASVLDWRMRDPEAHLKILTYEAPIEYVYDDIYKPSTIISQTEIGSHLPTFEAGIRNALRRKPSIILMGEMRDRETIGEGVTASMTGHLVYGTLHANGAADAVRRMVNVFPVEEKNARAQDILSSLRLIVAQMLIPSTDGKRVPIREYLVFTDEIKEKLLEAGVDNLTSMTKKALKESGKSFLEDAMDKFNEGLISEKWLNEIKKISAANNKDLEPEKINKEDISKFDSNWLVSLIKGNMKSQQDLHKAITELNSYLKDLGGNVEYAGNYNNEDSEKNNNQNENEWEEI